MYKVHTFLNYNFVADFIKSFTANGEQLSKKSRIIYSENKLVNKIKNENKIFNKFEAINR